jgi:hypothetical protein
MTPHRFADITQLATEFFDLAPIGMAILRLEEPKNPASLRILALNPAVNRASDVPTAAVGKRIDEDFPAIAKTPFPGQLAQVMRSGGGKPRRGVNHDATCQFTLTAFLILPDCVIPRARGHHGAAPAQRRAHESEIRYRKIFEASAAAICTFDATDRSSSTPIPLRRYVGLTAGAAHRENTRAFGFWTDGTYAARSRTRRNIPSAK